VYPLPRPARVPRRREGRHDHSRVDIRGVLDTSYERVPADAPDKVPTGIGFWCNAWPTNPAWRFGAVGVGPMSLLDVAVRTGEQLRIVPRKLSADLRKRRSAQRLACSSF
jgi:hypothetical protein